MGPTGPTYLTHIEVSESCRLIPWEEGGLVIWREWVKMDWSHVTAQPPYAYRCGHCSREVASAKGFNSIGAPTFYSYVCPNCDLLTLVGENLIVPGPLFGDRVGRLPELEATVYEEARKSFQAGAYTGCSLLCRKLLMNVSVSQGAEGNKTFQYYVNWLDAENHIPKNAKVWVDRLRQVGNDATHEVAVIDRATAEELLTFSAMLLKLIYEFSAA